MYELVIGNRNYSSWSLRAWLFLQESGLEFRVRRIPMFTDLWEREVGSISPAGRVPVLLDGNVRVWDSLAIIGHLRERHPEAVGWPDDPIARAEARSVSAEMHSGFLALRGELPQNLRARRPLSPSDLSADCLAQISRVLGIWDTARERFGDRGPWLFGDFTLADILYAPVALRFVTYDIELPPRAEEFVAAVQANDSIQEWCEAAAAEEESIRFIDELVPAADAPLTLG